MPPKKRKRIKEGARLPYADRATIDPRKLKDYALKPDAPGGKAKGFAALGIYRDDWRYVYDLILERLPDASATDVDLTDPGQPAYTVRIPIEGRNGRNGVLVTGWAVDVGHAPWLTTCYCQPEKRSSPSDD